MTIKNMPKIRAFRLPETLAFEVDQVAIERWRPEVVAASDGTAVIEILDVIGSDPWSGGGVTAQQVAAALKQAGGAPVDVVINSPGGDFFEGVAIYNLLRAHPAQINVQIVGLAASAASLIAMAGDQIEIAASAFIMIHNAWAVAVGSRHDFRAAADVLEPFDAAMAGVYAAQAEVKQEEAAGWMDAETWFGGQEAIDAGLATGLLPADRVKKQETGASARAGARPERRMEAALAKAGLSRGERRSLIGEVKGGKPGAAVTAMPGAGDLVAAARQLIETMKN